MKVNFYQRYSTLDKEWQFGIDCENKIYLAWIFYYLGKLGLNDRDFWFAPFEGYKQKLVKTYKVNGADTVAKLIYNRITKTFIRSKINESIARLKDNPKIEEGAVLKPKPKNGAKIDLKKILKDNEQPLKL